MATVVFKLFAGQGSVRTDGQTDGQSGEYMVSSSGSIKIPFKNHLAHTQLFQCNITITYIFLFHTFDITQSEPAKLRVLCALKRHVTHRNLTLVVI